MEILRSLSWRAWRRLRRRAPGRPDLVTPDTAELPPSAAEALGRAASSDFARLFYAHRGRPAYKWTHYLDVYERYLGPWRGRQVRLLEIGVWNGGSLELWRDYLGPQAIIFGLDIDPACAGRADPPNQVRIGSQADKGFVRAVVAEMGGLDIVIDDGSHIAHHQRASFQALWPLLSDGGLYLIEDLHTAYWPGHYKGGFRRAGTAVEMIKSLMDEVNRAYHWHGRIADVAAIHVYDSIAIVEKRAAPSPTQISVGAPARASP